jgi:mono/diheme cytochrome c family protein
MKNAQILCGVALAAQLVTAQVSAQDSAAITSGKQVFAIQCAPCHGTGPGDFGKAMLPGTDALRIKYQGKIPAALEQRSDLPAPILREFVRRGSWSMPPFRKTELSDAQIGSIAAYLAESSKRADK